jgi:predicted N-acetyltransferase YhbS
VNLRKQRAADKYEVTACKPTELSAAELEKCIALIQDGCAVEVNTMRRDLPNSSLLAVARTGDQIAGVGAIKPVRKPYAAKVSQDSGVEFPPDTLELGYVAVQRDHQNRGLSQRIASVLVKSLD